jgi:hypothetical protein
MISPEFSRSDVFPGMLATLLISEALFIDVRNIGVHDLSVR